MFAAKPPDKSDGAPIRRPCGADIVGLIRGQANEPVRTKAHHVYVEIVPPLAVPGKGDTLAVGGECRIHLMPAESGEGHRMEHRGFCPAGGYNIGSHGGHGNQNRRRESKENAPVHVQSGAGTAVFCWCGQSRPTRERRNIGFAGGRFCRNPECRRGGRRQ
jgi:hypothetical protein